MGHCANPARSKGRAVKTTPLIPHEARVLRQHHLRLADVVAWDPEISIERGGRDSGKASAMAARPDSRGWFFTWCLPRSGGIKGGNGPEMAL